MIKSNAPQSFPLTTEQLEPFTQALERNGFISTLKSFDEKGVTTFQEYRTHAYLKNQQASLTRKDPDLNKAPVVSIYQGKSIKAVTSPAANDIVTQIYKELPAPEAADVGM